MIAQDRQEMRTEGRAAKSKATRVADKQHDPSGRKGNAF